METIKARIRVRRDNANNWNTNNPILADGEIGVISSGENAGRHKVGDGDTPWNNLIFSTYTLPPGGIPRNDLSQNVVDSLNKADSALQQNALSGINQNITQAVNSHNTAASSHEDIRTLIADETSAINQQIQDEVADIIKQIENEAAALQKAIDVEALARQQAIADEVIARNQAIFTAINEEAEILLQAIEDEAVARDQQISDAIRLEAIARQDQVQFLNLQIQATNDVLEGVHNTKLTGATLTRTLNGTTEIQKSLFAAGTVFIAGKTSIFDTNGTMGVYIGDANSSTIIIATKTISPIGTTETPLLGQVPTNADLPQTAAAVETKFGRTPSLDNYVQVMTDETFGGARVEWYITNIDASGNITWGNPVPMNTGDFQVQTTAADAGKILIGGAVPGTFGESKTIDTLPVQNSNNLISSGGVWSWFGAAVSALKTSAKTVVNAVNELFDNKADKTDSRFQETEPKSVLNATLNNTTLQTWLDSRMTNNSTQRFILTLTSSCTDAPFQTGALYCTVTYASTNRTLIGVYSTNGRVYSARWGSTNPLTSASWTPILYKGDAIPITESFTTGDLNNYISNGTWWIGTGGTLQNMPSGVTNGYLFVISSAANIVKQILYRHGTINSNDHQQFTRTLASTGWSDWIRILTFNDIGTGSSSVAAGNDNRFTSQVRKVGRLWPNPPVPGQREFTDLGEFLLAILGTSTTSNTTLSSSSNNYSTVKGFIDESVYNNVLSENKPPVVTAVSGRVLFEVSCLSGALNINAAGNFSSKFEFRVILQFRGGEIWHGTALGNNNGNIQVITWRMGGISSLDPARIAQNASNRFVSDTEKNNWNGKSELNIGTGASNAAAGNHTHTVSSGINAANINAVPAASDENTTKFANGNISSNLQAWIQNFARKINGIISELAKKANLSHIHLASDITQNATNRFITDSERTVWNGMAAGSINNFKATVIRTHGSLTGTNTVTSTIYGSQTPTAGVSNTSFRIVIDDNTRVYYVHNHTSDTIRRLCVHNQSGRQIAYMFYAMRSNNVSSIRGVANNTIDNWWDIMADDHIMIYIIDRDPQVPVNP
ncbi:MAG: hypothetical protein FWD40_10055 [Treponema sp.]|nr:hypothetical protein [Treponema sp.]